LLKCRGLNIVSQCKKISIKEEQAIKYSEYLRHLNGKCQLIQRKINDSITECNRLAEEARKDDNDIGWADIKLINAHRMYGQAQGLLLSLDILAPGSSRGQRIIWTGCEARLVNPNHQLID